jgi:hypothetical protein
VHTLIQPIAFELDKQPDGQIVCGPGTARACDTAHDLLKQEIASGNSACILLTPSRAIGEWGKIPMGEIMANYLLSKGCMENQIVIVTAPSFNTRGEVRATKEFLATHPDFDRIIYTVKDWHAPRLACLVWWYFRKTIHQPQILTHRVGYPIRSLLREPIALLFNIYQLLCES